MFIYFPILFLIPIPRTSITNEIFSYRYCMDQWVVSMALSLLSAQQEMLGSHTHKDWVARSSATTITLNLNELFRPQPQPQSQLELGLRKLLISLKLALPFALCVSNHKTTTSKQHRKLKFGMQSYFNPTKRNMKNKIGVTPPPPV